jgi:alpha-L-fucosidase
VIPCAAESNLLAAGRWLKVNGDAVYGAGHSPFGEGLADYRTVTDANGRKTRLPFLDWRCTTKPDKLYFTIFRWPGNGFRLPTFKNEVKRAYLLGDSDRTELAVAGEKGARIVQMPHYAPNVMASVLVVEIQGEAAER